MPTRVIEVDINDPPDELPPPGAGENLLIIVRAGSSLVGKLFATPRKARQVAGDVRGSLPGAISPSRLRQVCLSLSEPVQPPQQLSTERLSDFFRRERDLKERDANSPRELPYGCAGRHGPSVSIIVCTHGRRDHLIRCLESIHDLHYEGFELILVDNNSPGESVFDLAGHFACRYLKEVRPGLSRSRNVALREAKGEIVAFTDDDAEVDADWLDAVVREFQDQAVGAVTGPVLPIELITRGQEWFEQLGYMGPSWFSHIRLTPDDFNLGLTPGVGANMAFRRELLVRRGGFQTVLGCGTPTGGAEDIEALLGVLRMGSSVKFTPDALVRHRHPIDLDEVQAIAFQRAASRTALLACLVHEDTGLLWQVILHVLERVLCVTRGPRQERLGMPRSSLPLLMRWMAFLYGPLAYGLSVRAARNPWPRESDD